MDYTELVWYQECQPPTDGSVMFESFFSLLGKEFQVWFGLDGGEKYGKEYQ